MMRVPASDPTRYLVSHAEPARAVLGLLNGLAPDGVAICVREDTRLVGTVTDGDIRRGLLDGAALDEPIGRFANTEPATLPVDGLTTAAVRALRARGLGVIPVVDDAERVVACVNYRLQRAYVPAHAVLMAGGLGSRLRPLTDDTPKPMLPVGGKPILEHNVARLAEFGIRRVTLSVNYLAEQIVKYFGDGAAWGVEIDYLREDRPLGTLGSLALAREYSEQTLLVMNGDLLTGLDYESFYLMHEGEGNDLTIGAVPYTVNVPFGVLETSGQRVVSVEEKPAYTYLTNAGAYLLDRALLEYVTPGERYDATDLIATSLADGKGVGHYRISGYWLDIGRPADYAKAQTDIARLQ